MPARLLAGGVVMTEPAIRTIPDGETALARMIGATLPAQAQP